MISNDNGLLGCDDLDGWTKSQMLMVYNKPKIYEDIDLVDGW